MNCIKCGSKNLDEKLICLDCGNDNHKGSHIDIDDIKPQSKNHHSFEKTRKLVLCAIFFAFIVLISFGTTLLVYYIKDKSNDKVIEEYNNLKKNSSVFVIYMGNDDSYEKLIEKYKKYYEFDYMNINYRKLTSKNTKKFKNELSLEKLKDSIIVYKKSELVLAKNFSSSNELDEYLKEVKVIPNIIEDPTNERNIFNETISSSDDTLVYISFVNNDLVNEKNEELNELCNSYKIKYQFIRGYVLSENQILNFLSQYGYSTMKSGLILTLEGGNIKKVIDMDGLYFDDYIEIFQNYDIISTMSDYLKYVDINAYDELINSNQKNIYIFGDSKCKYCDNIKYILGSIAKENELNIYYIDLADDTNIEDRLKQIKYEGTITYPLTIIVENKNILDFVIGLSEKDYFVNLLKKDGIIR